MDRSTRILRVLVVAGLALGVASVIASLWLWDGLPDALRSYEPPELGFSGSELAGVGLALLLLPLGLAATLGVLLLWRPARWLYVATSAAALALTPLFGPRVEPGWAAALYDLSLLSSGAVVALLYLSPAARHFGAAPREPIEPGSEPRPAARTSRLALFAGGLAIGAVAGIGALVLATVGIGYSAFHSGERAESEGREFGASASDAACLEEARRRLPDASSDLFDAASSFLTGCLGSAQRSGAFCRDVPAYETSQSWSATRCEGDAQFHACVTLYEAVQEHCHASLSARPSSL